MIQRRPALVTALAVASTLALAGCGSPADSSPVNSAPQSLTAFQKTSALRAAAALPKCKDGASSVASYAPGSISTDPGSWPRNSTMAKIRAKGVLTVGTSGDVLLWGATNPRTGDLEGYDIDLLEKVAATLGAKRIDYKVVNYGERLTSLEEGKVDLVAHTMTINCDRWQGTGSAPNAINFSTEYYRAGQKVLVRTDLKVNNQPVTNIGQLKGKRVCVPAASTNVEQVKGMGLVLTELDVIGDCLVKFQEGEVVAITGDDTVLAGFAAQDPYAKVVGDQFSQEPYGFGIKADDIQFTQFINALLEKSRSDGTLERLYDKWMANAVTGDKPAVPAPVYGRSPTLTPRTS
jgi:polar amino acid transport system substrate-binding protein